MLRDRLKTSAIVIVIVLLLLTLDYRVVIEGAEGVWLLPLLLFFSLGTAWEMSQILRVAGHPVRPRVTVVATAIISLSGAIPLLWAFAPQGYPADCPVGRLGWIVLMATLAVFLILIAEMCDYGTTPATTLGQTARRICSAVFVSVYVGLPMAMLVALRSLHAADSDGRFGLAALITTVIVTKVADAGAYFSGRALGRHKLTPVLSPGKTVEGAIGGMVAATLAAHACLFFLFPLMAPPAAGAVGGMDVKSGLSAVLSLPIWGGLVLGPVLAIAGMVGDLSESLFKRDSDVKDSGSLLPGLGGVWDVSDSLIASAVPAFFCFAAGVGG